MVVDRLFGNHMVLQRGKAFSIWGYGEDGEIVHVSLRGMEKQTTVMDGRWSVTFPAMDASRNENIHIYSKDNDILLEDVAFGEVWLAGGQSNMEYWMLYDADYDKERLTCANEDIRFFDYPKVTYEQQEEDFDYSRFGFWRPCDADHLKFYSAAAYYFARDLQKSLGVPVGIVGCNYGGTFAGCWMDEAHLKKHGQIWLDEYNKAVADLDVEKYKEEFRKNPMNSGGNCIDNPFTSLLLPGISREQQLKAMEAMPADMAAEQPGPYSAHCPGNLYKHMLSHVAPFAIRGAIYYQGESDDAHPEIYKDVFADMIQCWRELWQDKFPLICVQLAPFEAWLEVKGTAYPVLRRAQQMVSDTLEDVWMVSSSDVGMVYDIHPKKKQPIGQRLALSALGHVYGEKILCDAPRGVRADRIDGTLRITFEHAAGGLALIGDTVTALNIFGMEDDIAIPLLPEDFSARVEGELLVIKLEGESLYNHYRVDFAWTPYYEVNLYNRSKIPAVPFQLTI